MSGERICSHQIQEYYGSAVSTTGYQTNPIRKRPHKVQHIFII